MGCDIFFGEHPERFIAPRTVADPYGRLRNRVVRGTEADRLIEPEPPDPSLHQPHDAR